MKVHHILADGREVESVAGHVINLKDFPELQSALMEAARRQMEKEATIERQEAV